LELPDVKTYIVDGYNLLWKLVPLLMEQGRLEEARADLEGRLVEFLSAVDNTEALVVYDGQGGGSPPGESRHGVRVAFSPSGIPADEKILDYIQASADQGEVFVVSSDRKDITRRLGGTCARPVPSEDFIEAIQQRLAAFRSPGDDTRANAEKPPAPDSAEVDDWLDQFGMKED
jgi:predicted RNA-binding protein with PIN domain